MFLPRPIRNLILARQRAGLPARLTRRRVFILPTRAGVVFGAFLAAMLLAAINYTNNLAFLLTFILGSVAVVSAIHAYANLAGLVIEHGRLLPAYCGEEARLHLMIRAGGRERRNLLVCVGDCVTGVSLGSLRRPRGGSGRAHRTDGAACPWAGSSSPRAIPWGSSGRGLRYCCP